MGSHYQDWVDDACKQIMDSLKVDGVSRVILVGEAGIGKTWLAREICERATEKTGSCYMALWLNLNKELDERSLYKNIASQLSIFLENEGSEEDDSDNEDDEEQKNLDLMRLKDGILQKLRRKKLKREGNKNLLLVLDDEGSVTTEEKVMEELYLRDFLVRGKDRPLKILLTRRKEEEEDVTDFDWEIHSGIMVESHFEKSKTFDSTPLTLTDGFLRGLLEFLIKGGSHEMRRDYILRTGMRLPAALVVLVKSLNCISVNNTQYIVEFLSSLGSDTIIGCENPILRLAYELLYKASTRTIVDCFWHSLSLFEHCGCIYYQELIAHWILEGYFDPVRSVTKAFQDGHVILMELMNRGFLKVQEDNVVMPEVAMKNLIDTSRRGFLGRSRLRLYGGLGNINQVDDIIEAGRVTRNREKITTILVGGNDLRHESPEKFFEKLKDLEILGLFQPRLASFVPSLSKLTKLRVLVIRDCDLLKDIEELKALQGLHVLEVSGASFLKEISDDFFTAMPHLQSLHLSVLQIKSSPSSISKLKGLRCLIIRDCPVLEDLPDMQELVNLEAVDVSGARGLQTCFDKAKGVKKNKSKNRNFYHLQQLQLLDLSESQIERLPLFHDAAVAAKFPSLTRLLLRNCRKLIKLPSLKPLTGLQILDLSGTSSLVKMLDVCFEDKKELRVLNLSGTNLGQLPSTIEELCSLKELLIKDCINLEALPNIQKLTNLKVIDVSGCTKLHNIEGSFEDMYYLCEVNLSGTKVMIPPELPTETKITCPKRITLADGSVFIGEIWSEITDTMKSTRSDKASSSEASQEISENESEETGEIQPSETRASESTEKGGFTKERLVQVPIKRDIYKSILSRFDSVSQKEVMKIHETKDLSNNEFVSFVDINSTSLKSIFSEAKSVKVFSLKMCRDIKEIFSAEDEKSLGPLETLSFSITNLPLMETISCGVSFHSLKELRIECCPNIKTLFLEAAQMPSSLEVLHIKYCEKLEKVFKEGKVSTLTTLCLHELPLLSAVGAYLPNLTTLCLHELPLLSAVGAYLPNLETLFKKNCPKLLVLQEDLPGWVEVDPSDASPQT